MADVGALGKKEENALLDDWQRRLQTVEGRLVLDFQTRFYRALGPTLLRAHPDEVARAALSLAGSALVMRDDGQVLMDEASFVELARVTYRTCSAFHRQYSAGERVVGVSQESLEAIRKAAEESS